MTSRGGHVLPAVVYGLVILVPLAWMLWRGWDAASLEQVGAILGRTDVPGLLANSIMLAPVMEFNQLGNPAKFARIAEYLGVNTAGLSERDAASAAVEAMRKFAADLNIPDHLSEFGIKDKDIPELAAGVMKVTRLLANNPRELTQKDAEAIYRSVL